MRFGIYIHFPWCRKRCPYCDFAIVVSKEGPAHQEYLAAILRELEFRAEQFAGKTLVSIYFGGGTPSIWDPECIETLIATLRQRFDAEQADIEISLECNPSDCVPERFAAWKKAGVNRLLVGVQATNQQDLVTLGRDHSMGDGVHALEKVLNEEFRSVGADVILGVPGSRNPLASLKQVAKMAPPHLSVYELTIEERTAFAKMVSSGDLLPEDEDRLAELYTAVHEHLCAAGYEHYEVSSYAKKGHRSRHNSLYWQAESYLGLGNGAASLWVGPDGQAKRWQNKRSSHGYLLDEASQHTDSAEEITAVAFQQERLWLSMRTSDGAPIDWFEAEGTIEELLRHRLAKEEGGRLRPTLRGFLYNNQIMRILG